MADARFPAAVPRSLYTSLAVSLAALALAIALRWLIDPILGDALPLVTLFGAVAVAVWTGGWRHAALVALVDRLARRGFTLLDIQWVTPHLEQFGATAIPRSVYLKKLKTAVAKTCSWE